MSGTSDQSNASQANEYAVEALKQVLTLAGAILALTITFLKDALGEARAEARLTFLMPVAWGLLTFVIWMAWVAIADAARRLGTGETAGYAFAPGTRARRLARNAQIAFVVALAVLALFASVNLSLYFRTKPSTQDSGPPKQQSSAPATRPELVGHVGPFTSGRFDALQPGASDVESLAEALRVRAQGRELLSLVLVGSADKFRIRGRLQANYGANSTLARARAEWVRERLTAYRTPSDSALYVALVTGARARGPELSSRDAEMDRVVTAYAFWDHPAQGALAQTRQPAP